MLRCALFFWVFWLTRCQRFYTKIKELLESGDEQALADFCSKHSSTIFRIEKYIDFCEQHSLPMGKVSERAIRQLEPFPKAVQKTVVRKIRKSLKKGKAPSYADVRSWTTEEYSKKFHAKTGESTEVKRGRKEQPSEDFKLLALQVSQVFCPRCPTERKGICNICPVLYFWDFLKLNGLKIYGVIPNQWEYPKQPKGKSVLERLRYVKPRRKQVMEITVPITK